MDLQTTISKQLHKEDVTSCLQCGHMGRVLVVGFSDGILKIYSLESGDFDEPRQQIGVFTNVNGKKGPVTSLHYSVESGILFAATTLGCVKLVRIAL
jgi:hypothetical protein